MIGISKVMIFLAIIITTLLYWTTSNVCRYNFTIEKKTNQLNVIAAEISPSIPLTEVYYFRELNCNNVDLKWDYKRVLQIVDWFIFHVYNYCKSQNLTSMLSYPMTTGAKTMLKVLKWKSRILNDRWLLLSKGGHRAGMTLFWRIFLQHVSVLIKPL